MSFSHPELSPNHCYPVSLNYRWFLFDHLCNSDGKKNKHCSTRCKQMAMKVNKKKNKKPIRAAEEYLCFSSIPVSISVLCSTKQSQYSLLVSNLKLGGSLYMSQTRFVTFLLWSAVQFVFFKTWLWSRNINESSVSCCVPEFSTLSTSFSFYLIFLIPFTIYFALNYIFIFYFIFLITLFTLMLLFHH